MGNRFRRRSSEGLGASASPLETNSKAARRSIVPAVSFIRCTSSLMLSVPGSRNQTMSRSESIVCKATRRISGTSVGPLCGCCESISLNRCFLEVVHGTDSVTLRRGYMKSTRLTMPPQKAHADIAPLSTRVSRCGRHRRFAGSQGLLPHASPGRAGGDWAGVHHAPHLFPARSAHPVRRKRRKKWWLRIRWQHAAGQIRVRCREPSRLHGKNPLSAAQSQTDWPSRAHC